VLPRFLTQRMESDDVLALVHNHRVQLLEAETLQEVRAIAARDDAVADDPDAHRLGLGLFPEVHHHGDGAIEWFFHDQATLGSLEQVICLIVHRYLLVRELLSGVGIPLEFQKNHTTYYLGSLVEFLGHNMLSQVSISPFYASSIQDTWLFL
jgi:hypothetical protein